MVRLLFALLASMISLLSGTFASDIPSTSKYAVILDAGSMGTRVSIAEFECKGDEVVRFVKETYDRVKPGLSSFNKDPEGAAASLEPLLKLALSTVPSDMQSTTPIALCATAGLRLLPEEAVRSITSSVRSYLKSLPFKDCSLDKPEFDMVSVLDGSDEGVFAWTTVNFLLGNIQKDSTEVVMDLGGGSVQIVYESPLFDDNSEDYREIHISGKSLSLYQHSYLGYGLSEARRKIKSMFTAGGMSFPFLPEGYSLEYAGHQLTGKLGDFDQNLSTVLGLFKFEGQNQQTSFNGVHQPEFPPNATFIGITYFFSRLSTIMPSQFTLFDLEARIREMYVSEPMHGILKDKIDIYFDVVYIYALLAYGFKIPQNSPIKILTKIDGFEAGWPLGAALNILSS